MSLADTIEIKTVLRPVSRWTPARKFWLLTAIEKDIITMERAMELHSISAEEMHQWQISHNIFGLRGLSVTALQSRARLL